MRSGTCTIMLEPAEERLCGSSAKSVRGRAFAMRTMPPQNVDQTSRTSRRAPAFPYAWRLRALRAVLRSWSDTSPAQRRPVPTAIARRAWRQALRPPPSVAPLILRAWVLTADIRLRQAPYGCTAPLSRNQRNERSEVSSDIDSSDTSSSDMGSREAQLEGEHGTQEQDQSEPGVAFAFRPSTERSRSGAVAILPGAKSCPLKSCPLKSCPLNTLGLGAGGLGSMTLRPGSLSPLSPDPPQQSERDRHSRPEVAQDLVLVRKDFELGRRWPMDVPLSQRIDRQHQYPENEDPQPD